MTNECPLCATVCEFVFRSTTSLVPVTVRKSSYFRRPPQIVHHWQRQSPRIDVRETGYYCDGCDAFLGKTKPEFLKRIMAVANVASDLGIPDLSLVTVRQMTTELKRRNLCFALVWSEPGDKDQISIEGAGQPTQVVGLLARGMHLGVQWADRQITWHTPGDQE